MKEAQTEGDHDGNTKGRHLVMKLCFAFKCGNPLKANFKNNVPMAVTVVIVKTGELLSIFSE